MKSWISIAAAAGTVVAFLAVGYQVLYSPTGMQQRSVFPAPKIPNPEIHTILPGSEDVRIPGDDGQTIHGYFLSIPKASKSLLYFHGNGVTIGEQIDIFKTWQKAGFNVLAVEYRGYGGAPGLASEQNVYADAHAAYRWLRKRLGADAPILAVGWSLGSTVAAEVASREPVAAAVLLAPFTSMGAMARLRNPNLPLDRLITYPLNTLDYVSSLRCPLLIVHGTADRTVPVSMGRQLYEAAKDPKQFLAIPGADHADVFGPQVLSVIQKL